MSDALSLGVRPEINVKRSDIAEGGRPDGDVDLVESMEALNRDKHAVNESASEIECRSAFNVASDLLRRLYADDPDNRRDMLQLWSARHHIDIGFFCDFAASITNSTPRGLSLHLPFLHFVYFRGTLRLRDVRW